MPESEDFAGAIQFLAPNGQKFELKLDVLRQIFNENIRDRYVVVVSIAGALRNGKSFLINFFLKYLYAQYKTQNLTDWIGEQTISELSGFNWRGGIERETVGIWMWSEIFTYDFDNGDKVAIILMDTQGIFDNESSIKDCSSIFAISMLLSSVQCFNMMRGVREDDLQHLELFTSYARLALEECNEKPFQKLLFIVRDWPWNFQFPYGYSPEYMEHVLKENEKQVPEMRTLRANIKSSFNDVEAFLMPYPGKRVAQEKNYKGCATEIELEFLNCVKDLVPSIFDPKKLIVKRINGKKIRASEFVVYLEEYVKALNSDEMPVAKSIFAANADGQIRTLYDDCSVIYVTEMGKAFDDPEIYFTEKDLNQKHAHANDSSLLEFRNAKKLASPSLVTKWEEKLTITNRQKFSQYLDKNENRRLQFSSIWAKISKSARRCRTMLRDHQIPLLMPLAMRIAMRIAMPLKVVGPILCVALAVSTLPVPGLTFLFETATYVTVGACSLLVAFARRMFV